MVWSSWLLRMIFFLVRYRWVGVIFLNGDQSDMLGLSWCLFHLFGGRYIRLVNGHVWAQAVFYNIKVRLFDTRWLGWLSLPLYDRVCSLQRLFSGFFLFGLFLLCFLLDLAVWIYRSFYESKGRSSGEVSFHFFLVPLKRPFFFNYRLDVWSSRPSDCPVERRGDVEHRALVLRRGHLKLLPLVFVEFILFVDLLSLKFSLNVILHHL